MEKCCSPDSLNIVYSNDNKKTSKFSTHKLLQLVNRPLISSCVVVGLVLECVELDVEARCPRMRSCTKSSNEMIPCTTKGKPLVLSWGRTPRLDSDVRVSKILGFPNILLISVSVPKWEPYRIRVRSNRVLRMLLGLRKAYHVQMDLLSFIQTADPIRVRVGER
ncbi:hypothetical protein Tco_0227701 [Tanacetum coccineum]